MRHLYNNGGRKEEEVVADESSLRALKPGEVYKYLGLEVGPTKSRSEPGRALAALVRDLSSLQKAPLKPQQKLWAVKNVIVPKHQYQRVLGHSNQGTLRKFDLEIRTFLKKALHLPTDTVLKKGSDLLRVLMLGSPGLQRLYSCPRAQLPRS
ncbi:Retrovirus-related Pol polyprotein from type-1 retrotransposable element R2 [Portunus trituberculatus]|uniref:Retrovirus-related Pol polyprotein from type-1 retrotransposable element R2 n=1 Tax=Portunus trituberculatus TaxID=210409 RepID=A0A5B7EH65_PORTR|nr:Retrovirus-related Pol polyprotein from type-1 retrotransposable element R2 [Portunus trituberculatus]